MEYRTFKDLEQEANIYPEVQEYLSTFDILVKNALRETPTLTGAIPFKGAMTLDNIPTILKLIPDLYDYLKSSYNSIETDDNILINKVLDAALIGDFAIIKNIGEEYCNFLVEKYIAFTYYHYYLPGYPPNAFSTDYTSSKTEYIILPRPNFWWI